MLLSNLSVKRPVLATIVSLLIVIFGVLSFNKTNLREYPDIDPPIISINTNYKGASARIIETKITRLIENQIAGIEGIKSINSISQDGRSKISVEFNINRNIDDAANDIRDRVSGLLGNIPTEVDPPEVQKSDSSDTVVMWLNLNGENMNIMELTDYAHRYLVDKFSSIEGVSRVVIGGAKYTSMRIWVDPILLASHNLTITDVENALKNENIELPAGTIESKGKDFIVRVKRNINDTRDIENIPLSIGNNKYIVRLKEVAKIEIAATENRSLLRGNRIPMVGLGIIKQSKANIIEVSDKVKEMAKKVNQTLPSNISIENSYDTSLFVKSAIKEVYKALFLAIILVTLVIYVFLGSIRAMIIPVITIPVSLIGSFIIIYLFEYSINLLTLLGLVLAIGLIVDDAIVVIENIYRRIELKEDIITASSKGTKQVSFAVISTTIVLISVFTPIIFIEGEIGKLFTEFVVAISAAIIFSTFVALTLSPAISSKILNHNQSKNLLYKKLNYFFEKLKIKYLSSLRSLIHKPLIFLLIILSMIIASFFLIKELPKELAPQEDRGVLILFIKGPQGVSYNYIEKYVKEVEKRLIKFSDNEEFKRLIVRAPRTFGITYSFDDAIGIIVLNDWENRKNINFYKKEINKLLSDIPGVLVFTIAPQSFGGGNNKPVQFVIQGSNYEELSKWKDIIISEISKNKNFIGFDHDFKETKPQIKIEINKDIANNLGVSFSEINLSLETLLGSKRVTTYIDRGEEYDIILEIDKEKKKNISDIYNIYVRSNHTSKLIPLSSLVTIKEYADVQNLYRYNKLKSITFESNLKEGYDLFSALNYLEDLVKTKLPDNVNIDYKGESLEFKESNSEIYFLFLVSFIILFLVLAGQFENFIHPIVIITTVPLAITGGLIALFLLKLSLNIYTQIGLLILIGIAAKNGILIVEFINQLREKGIKTDTAILQAAEERLRPITMTSITTIIGTIPLITSFGAGSEARIAIGIILFSGVTISTLFTIYAVPTMYKFIVNNN